MATHSQVFLPGKSYGLHRTFSYGKCSSLWGFKESIITEHSQKDMEPQVFHLKNVQSEILFFKGDIDFKIKHFSYIDGSKNNNC